MSQTATTAPRSKQEILVALSAVFEEVTDVVAAEVHLDRRLVDDLDVDSLSLAELSVCVQDTFGVEITDDRLVELRTVGDIVDTIHDALARV